ncbi:MAG: tetratricopeptide repeat protein [Sideroxydans sp.]
MSLINQVLNQLEQRGAHTAPDQTLIRAVPMRREIRWGKGLMAAFVLLGVAALAAGLLAGKPDKRAKVEAGGIVTPTRAVEAVSAVMSAEVAQPSARMSFELSMLPLPDVLRTMNDPVPESAPLVAGIAPEQVPVLKVEARPRPPSAVRIESVPPLKKISPQQQADAEYRKGLQARQAGHVPEAIATFEAALRTNERHERARLALAALLLDNGQNAAAERVLRAGLVLKPVQLGLGMALARMQVERDELQQAVDTLRIYLPQADNNADYQAFYAALLQRQQRHKEAINHYQLALRMQPRNGVWLMGYAISLQAVDRKEDAKLAYRQALATQTLSPELSAFVQQKLQEISLDSPPK